MAVTTDYVVASNVVVRAMSGIDWLECPRCDAAILIEGDGVDDSGHHTLGELVQLAVEHRCTRP